MKRTIGVVTIFLGMCLTSLAGAATLDFGGTLHYNTDIAQFTFSLDSDATNVRVWTDSFQDGINFDPITALWTSSGTLIAENDDNATINPSTQTYWDSGFALSTLAAGDYIFTIATYDNFARGTTLADGFRFDGTTPVPIEQWWVGKPGYYHVWFDGVDSVVPPSVPEPSTFLLLGAGLFGIGLLRKRLKS
jgi:hypothetical protein